MEHNTRPYEEAHPSQPAPGARNQTRETENSRDTHTPNPSRAGAPRISPLLLRQIRPGSVGKNSHAARYVPSDKKKDQVASKRKRAQTGNVHDTARPRRVQAESPPEKSVPDPQEPTTAPPRTSKGSGSVI